MNDPRTQILHAFRAALGAVDPYAAVRRSLQMNADGSASFDGRRMELSGGVDLIAVGKAAVPMIAGAIDSLGDSVGRGFVITKVGHIDRALPDFVECHEADHPVPDERSIAATSLLLDWASSVPADRMVICLISGGGSALLEAPVPDVSLEDFQQMTLVLLRAGADIHQLNAVRSQVSRVKGGGLRAAIPAHRVLTLALSDVLGNDPAVIASGPTVPIRTTRADARQVALDLGAWDALPEAIRSVLDAQGGPEHAPTPGDMVAVIADNGLAVEAAADALGRAGHVVELDEAARTGEARKAAIDWVRMLKGLPEDISAVVAGGELTVTVSGEGLGGRNTEFALAAAIELDRQAVADWTVASLATDGQDALTGAAGAVVDGATVRELRRIGLDARASLANNDTSPVLRAIQALVETGPTGTNVNDLYFAIRNS